jgi:large conductance mechanosensitive channel
MKGFIDFIRKGNLVALAVAFVMGAAFAALVASFTTNMISPLLGLFGTQNLADYSACLGTCTATTDPATGVTTYSGVYLGWGAFLTALISFLITAAVLYFFVVKPYEGLEERLKKNKDEEVSPTEVDLLTEIRDALVAKSDDAT